MTSIRKVKKQQKTLLQLFYRKGIITDKGREGLFGKMHVDVINLFEDTFKPMHVNSIGWEEDYPSYRLEIHYWWSDYFGEWDSECIERLILSYYNIAKRQGKKLPSFKKSIKSLPNLNHGRVSKKYSKVKLQ